MARPSKAEQDARNIILESTLELARKHKDIGPFIQDKWITSELLRTAVNMMLPPTQMPVTDNHLKRRIGAVFLDSDLFGDENKSGVARHYWSKKNYYYLQSKKEKEKTNRTKIIRPNFGNDEDHFKRVINFCRHVTDTLNGGGSEESPAKEKRQQEAAPVTPLEKDTAPPPKKKMRLDDKETWSFWNSFAARLLFTGVGETPMDGKQLKALVRKWVELLRKCESSAEAWRLLVIGGDENNKCTENDRFLIRQRSMLLAETYEIALEKMDLGWSFGKCCVAAIDSLKRLRLCQANNPKTIEAWNRQFRAEGAFPNPRAKSKVGLPPFLVRNPEAVEELDKFCVKNLYGLTVHNVREHILGQIVPPLYESWKAKEGNEHKTDKDFLADFHLRTLAPQTVYNWMKLLGMKFDAVRKTFYVDGHEREDVKKDRSRFTKKYLLVYEPRCRRWIQVKKEEVKELGLQESFGYSYTADDGTEMIEYHEDYFFSSQKASDGAFIVEMSVRAPAGSKELVIFGQDESVFSQNSVKTKFWTSSKGQRVILPKSTGHGYMISAFQSRNFGFGMQLTDEELKQVNDYREGKHYWDTEAAKEVSLTRKTNKEALKESPFVRTMVIGANNDGYWNSFHMAIQLEDCIDCLRILHPNLDYVFLFDHSQGHNRKRQGGLDAGDLNKGFGGKQPEMRPSVMTEGCLGPFPRKLQVGDVQQMCWPKKEELTSDDIGPFDLSREERIRLRDDIVSQESTEKDKTVAMLVREIQTKRPGYLKNGDKTRLNAAKVAAIELGISLKYRKQNIEEGWCGKPKGMLQILWERGWIDVSKISQYTVRGKQLNRETKEWDTTYSMKRILSECEDFANEKTHLQVMAEELGVLVDFTPKFHPELAGEGIEYAWGHAKNLYRRKPLSQKNTKEKFLKLVHDCLKTEGDGFTIQRIRRMSARARAYICTYRHIELQQQKKGEQQEGEKKEQSVPLLLDDINKLMKRYKTHRCAFDFDTGFVNELMDEKPKKKRRRKKKKGKKQTAGGKVSGT